MGKFITTACGGFIGGQAIQKQNKQSEHRKRMMLSPFIENEEKKEIKQNSESRKRKEAMLSYLINQ